MGLLLVVIELFSLGITAKALRAKIDKRNISAKSMHLTSLYPTASTSTKDNLTVYVTMFVLYAKVCSIKALIMGAFGGLT